MFFISGYQNNLYGITDTSDGVTEWYSFQQVEQLYKSVNIGGCGINKLGQFSILCKSPNVFEEFIDRIKPTLAKLITMQVTSRKQQVEKIKQLAYNYGLISSSYDAQNQLVIDLDNKSLLLKEFKYIYTWESDGTKNVITSKDVLDKDVTRLSNLGVEAFKFIYLELGGEKYTLYQLLNLLNEVTGDFKIQNIKYVGITPSNKMFKNIDYYSDCWSVSFNTIEYFNANHNSLITKKQKEDYWNSFREYASKCSSRFSGLYNLPYAVTKVSIKY